LVRYTTTGTLDATFGSAGHVITPFGSGNARSNGMVIQPDGKIVVVAHDFTSCALMRFLGSGALDPKFGAKGIVPFGFGSCGRIALQKDGKIVVGDGTGRLVRFDPDGTLDTSFGNAGSVDVGLRDGGMCCDIALA